MTDTYEEHMQHFLYGVIKMLIIPITKTAQYIHHNIKETLEKNISGFIKEVIKLICKKQQKIAHIIIFCFLYQYKQYKKGWNAILKS